tara:strand:- start:370 stop:1902 length:1533 start_codon:yes stop_codon:yes gene_type:complete
MLGVNKINYKSFFFILLVILLFKPTWLISNDSLGTGGDDLSYWIHASTLAYDYDLNYTDDHSLVHQNYHEETNAPYHSPGSGYANSIFVKIFSLLDDKSKINEIRINPIGSYSLLGFLFGTIFYCLLGFYFFDKLIEKKGLKVYKKNIYLIVYLSTLVHFVTNRFLMAHSFEFFLVVFIFYLLETKDNFFDKYIYAQLILAFFLLSITRPSTAIYTLCLFIVYYKKIRYKFSDVLTNTFSTVVVVFLYVLGAQKIYNQNSFLLNLESNNTTASISGDLNIQWILNGFSKIPNLIFSPSLGLIWSAPVIIIGIVLLFLNKNYLNKFNILSKIFIFLYLFGAFLVLFVWQGREGSFGQRLLIGVIPFCAYQLCIFLNNKKKDFLVPLIIVAFVGHLFLYSSSDLTLKTGITLWNTQNEWAAESYYLNLFYEIFNLENWASAFSRTIIFINVINLFDFLDSFNIFELSQERNENLNQYISKINDIKILYLFLYNSIAITFALIFEKLTRSKLK